MPQLLLGERGVILLEGVDLLKHVTTIGMLHHNAQMTSVILEEAFFKPDDIRVSDRSENSDLIQCVFLLFLLKFSHFDFLHCILSLVSLSLHAEDFRE